MDNVVTGVADDKRAVHYYTHSRELLATAGMNLRQWTTNSKVLKQKVKENNSGAPDNKSIGPRVERRKTPCP